jgi:hypothetical protein
VAERRGDQRLSGRSSRDGRARSRSVGYTSVQGTELVRQPAPGSGAHGAASAQGGGARADVEGIALHRDDARGLLGRPLIRMDGLFRSYRPASDSGIGDLIPGDVPHMQNFLLYNRTATLYAKQSGVRNMKRISSQRRVAKIK